jgi:hypothetical protein
MYHGEKEFGLEVARRTMHTMTCEKGWAWSVPNLFLGRDIGSKYWKAGDRGNGFDYGQDLMLWILPAAIAHQDVTGPCQPGGLVDRILKAGRP